MAAKQIISILKDPWKTASRKGIGEFGVCFESELLPCKQIGASIMWPSWWYNATNSLWHIIEEWREREFHYFYRVSLTGFKEFFSCPRSVYSN